MDCLSAVQSCPPPRLPSPSLCAMWLLADLNESRQISKQQLLLPSFSLTRRNLLTNADCSVMFGLKCLTCVPLFTFNLKFISTDSFAHTSRTCRRIVLNTVSASTYAVSLSLSFFFLFFSPSLCRSTHQGLREEGERAGSQRQNYVRPGHKGTVSIFIAAEADLMFMFLALSWYPLGLNVFHPRLCRCPSDRLHAVVRCNLALM